MNNQVIFIIAILLVLVALYYFIFLKPKQSSFTGHELIDQLRPYGAK